LKERIVASSEPVTLIGGGDAEVSQLSDALKIAPVCVAADGGAELARRANIPLRAIIGDMDSISADTLSQIPPDRQIKISEQETTDFDKALRHIDAPLVIGVGFLGGRLDHQLAALHILAVQAHRPCILIAKTEILFIAPPTICVQAEPGDVISIFPLGPVTGRSRGLEWPIDGIAFDTLSKIGTSNRALGEVALEMSSPNAVIMMPRRLIQPVAQALVSSDAVGWPPRGRRYKAQLPL
jgi:thiamine pyrophosphokinase